MAQKLGKGLNAIFGDDIDSVLNEIDTSKEGVKSNAVELKVSSIRPNPYQPRKEFDKDALNELAESIKEHGVIQPIIVRETNPGYELIAGERRLRASKLAGLKDIPAIIKVFNDQQMMEISILENIQREDLNVIEEAKAYEQLISKLSYTQDKLAKRMGKSRVYVTNLLRLLKLPQEIISMIQKDQLSMGHARALINITDEDQQIKLAQKVINEGLTVRDIEKIASGEKTQPVKKKAKRKDPYLEDVRKAIESLLTTSVTVEKNKITIDYHGTDDLNRILDILGLIED